MAKNRRGVSRPRKKKTELLTPRRYAAERVNYEMHILIGDCVFESVDEANAFYARFATDEARKEALDGILNDTHRAQFLAYDALEDPCSPHSLLLAREALALDPDNIDAMHCKILSEAPGPAEIEAGMRALTERAEEALGAFYFKKNRRHFWGLLETRPYMRAMLELGSALCNQERFGEAADVFGKMLDLNEHDNQGARYEAVGCLLAAGRLDEAQAIVDKFKDEEAPLFLLANALLAVLAGDNAAGKEYLFAAFAKNQYLMQMFVGVMNPFEFLNADAYPGSQGEAARVFSSICPIFVVRPSLLEWATDETMALIEDIMEQTDKPGRRRK